MRGQDRLSKIATDRLPSPCYIIDETAIEENCLILDRVQQQSGCRVLLALKGFAIFSVFPTIRKHLYGTCASGLYEARLGKEKFGKEVHVFAPAYNEHEFTQMLKISDHIVFNSLSQWNRFRPLIERSRRKISCGMRINPEYSEVPTDLWNPCARYSRFGVKAEDMRTVPAGIEGLHFHAMCQQDSKTLERLLGVVERKFGHQLSQVRWVNFGGGHLVTAPGYDVDRLCRIISDFREEYGVDVYMEPGEAVALNAGVLLSTVLDIVHNEMDVAILDISAWAHIQDILTTSFRPDIIGGNAPDQPGYKYRLASRSCLSGDIIGDYSFAKPLGPGSRIMVSDMASYSVVSNNMFNGLPLPAIAILTKSGRVRVVRRSSYEDFLSRL